MRPRHVVVDVLEPGEPEHERAEEEAAVDVGPDQDEDRDRPQALRVRTAVGTSSRTTAKSAMPMSCGRSPRATAETRNAASVSQAARRSPALAARR